MKKILFILPYFELGGTLTSFNNLIPLIDSSKYQIDVYALTPSGKGIGILPNNISILNIPRRNEYLSSGGIRTCIIRLLKRIKRVVVKLGYDPSDVIFKRMTITLSGKYDVVIAFQEGQATRMAQYIDAPIRIAWVHSIYSRFKNMSNAKAVISAYAKYNRIVCVSNTAAKDMIDCEPSFKDKISVVYNAIDLKKLNLLSQSHIALGDCFNIVSVGRIDPVKRFSYIPQIASELKAKGLKFNWWIIGGKSVVEEWDLLRNNIEKFDVSECVHMLGSMSNPYPYIRKSNILLCLSTSESFNYTIAEAKALCTPVVTTDFPSAFEFVEDGVTGLISPIEEISAKIESLLTDKELYNKISINLKGLIGTEPVTKKQFETLIDSY